MISNDQPTCFPDTVVVAVSSRGDGTMLCRAEDKTTARGAAIVQRRQAFCHAVGVEYSACVHQTIIYDADSTYSSICDVDTTTTSVVRADILYTTTPERGLFLPLADCIGTVIYDPVQRALAVAHLGRHSTIANAMTTAIARFKAAGSRPKDLQIWMAPSVKQASYRMEYFRQADDELWRPWCMVKDDGFYLDLQGYNTARAIEAGVRADRIVVSPVNTAASRHYFSHSQGDTKDRFAIVAMLKV